MIKRPWLKMREIEWKIEREGEACKMQRKVERKQKNQQQRRRWRKSGKTKQKYESIMCK